MPWIISADSVRAFFFIIVIKEVFLILLKIDATFLVPFVFTRT